MRMKGEQSGRRIGEWFRKRQKRKKAGREYEKYGLKESIPGNELRKKGFKVRWRAGRKKLSDRFAGLKWRFGLYIPLCIFMAFLGSCIIGNSINYLQDWYAIKYTGMESDKIHFYYDRIRWACHISGGNPAGCPQSVWTQPSADGSAFSAPCYKKFSP